jgi:hypothetical protein
MLEGLNSRILSGITSHTTLAKISGRRRAAFSGGRRRRRRLASAFQYQLNGFLESQIRYRESSSKAGGYELSSFAGKAGAIG